MSSDSIIAPGCSWGARWSSSPSFVKKSVAIGNLPTWAAWHHREALQKAGLLCWNHETKMAGTIGGIQTLALNKHMENANAPIELRRIVWTAKLEEKTRSRKKQDVSKVEAKAEWREAHELLVGLPASAHELLSDFLSRNQSAIQNLAKQEQIDAEERMRNFAQLLATIALRYAESKLDLAGRSR